MPRSTHSAADIAKLKTELSQFIDSEAGSWASEPDGPQAPPPKVDAWDVTPEIDSKAIARSSPIFERVLGIKLDVNWIKKGGYHTVEEAVSHLLAQEEKASLSQKEAKQ